MRIAFIVGQFPSLSQTFILRQITGLIDRGHDVEVFARSRSNDPFSHGDIKKYGLQARTSYLGAYAASSNGIVRVLKRAGLVFANFSKNPEAIVNALNPVKFGKRAILLQVFDQIAPFLSKGPYDIVHCHFGPNGNLGVLLRDTALLCQKVIITFHGYDVSSYTTSRGKHSYSDLFRRGDLFLAVSERIREKLISLGCREDKILIHGCGIDTSKFRPLSGKQNTNGRASVVTIARLVEKKGVEDGIHAVAKLLQSNVPINYKIVGDGPRKPALQKMIEELQIGSNVTLVGWKRQEEVAEVLREADILLAPSVTSESGDEEGIPVTLMEAFAHGIPVVSTYHAGIPELVRNGESGFLVPERDPSALAERMKRLVLKPELRLAMGLNGRRFVEEHYDIDKLNDRQIEIYQHLLAGELPSSSSVQQYVSARAFRSGANFPKPQRSPGHMS